MLRGFPGAHTHTQWHVMKGPGGETQAGRMECVYVKPTSPPTPLQLNQRQIECHQQAEPEQSEAETPHTQLHLMVTVFPFLSK